MWHMCSGAPLKFVGDHHVDLAATFCGAWTYVRHNERRDGAPYETSRRDGAPYETSRRDEWLTDPTKSPMPRYEVATHTKASRRDGRHTDPTKLPTPQHEVATDTKTSRRDGLHMEPT